MRAQFVVERVRACELLLSSNGQNGSIGNYWRRRGVEEGIRGSEEAEGSGRSGVSCAAQFAISEGQGSPCKTYDAGVLQEQSGEIPSSNTGKAGRAHAASPGDVCGRTRNSAMPCGGGEGMADANRTQSGNRNGSRSGMTHAEFSDMMTAQDGKCAICGHQDMKTRSELLPVVDHCHNVGRWRPSCMNCNMGLGKFKDDPERLRRAAEYLLSHG